MIAAADYPVYRTTRYGHGIAGRIGIVDSCAKVRATDACAVTRIDGVADNVIIRSRTMLSG